MRIRTVEIENDESNGKKNKTKKGIEQHESKDEWEAGK
jgi:hypothetical protein